MSKIQAVTVMTLDGFLPETDNVLTQWVMNHRKGLFIGGYAAMPGFYLIPYWTCFAKKTAKVPPLPIWQKFMMLNPLNFYGDYSTTTLWMNSSFICFLILPEKGIPYRIFFLPGNGSCIKSQLFPTVSVALFTVIHAGCNSE